MDKENANPGVFRRKGEGNASEKGGVANWTSGGKKHVGLEERSGDGDMRKRTLSDFMEEKDAEHERERIREATISGKKQCGLATSSSTQHAKWDMDYSFSPSSWSVRVFSNLALTAIWLWEMEKKH